MQFQRQFISRAMERASVDSAFVRRIHLRWSERVIVIMLSYAESWYEANDCQLFVHRELRLHSNANAKIRLRLVVIFSLVREELNAV